ncbi:MAG TPA: tyrosine-type recombinase/integrase [Pyrinomonadaceae bacterium]|nr:tyrosine-type recombinase/integrase [Pyrinomonadaceae bacterium]
MMKNFYQYIGMGGQTLHGYERQYKRAKLRKKGFVSKSDAERDLRRAMNDLDAEERGETRTKPTTAQEALTIYRHNLDVRARDKDYQYGHNVKSNCKILQEFVDHFGPNRLIRECTETNLREFYQILCFRPTLNKNSAGVFIERVQGMLKAAQKAKPDLVNWLRPALKVNRTPEFERRVVEPWEYATLVNILLNPPLAPSRQRERNALWREAGDAVQLLRMTGGRLNEILRMKLDQFMWPKGKVRLFASKTENQRDLPLWDCIRDVVQRRISEGLTDGEYLFPRAKVMTFDNAIARACRKAARLAKLNYGQANGFTCHSLRHTFVTDMMEATGNDVALVMSHSGHRSIESFKIYLHPTHQGRILANQRMKVVGDFLGTFLGIEGKLGLVGRTSSPAKRLKRKQVVL